MQENDIDRQKWLGQNESLRMDANLEIFPESRRRFHLARYEFASQYCEGKRVLDGACGTGYGSDLLGKTAVEVQGIDCSQEAVDYASKVYGRPTVAFQKSFVEATQFESGSFDVVVSLETVEHTLCPDSHIMEVARLLNPDHGLAVLSIPNSWGLTDHHFIDFNMEKLDHLVRKYFQEVKYFYQNPDTHASLPGIGELKSADPGSAQCIVAVCSSPIINNIAIDRSKKIMDEIYKVAFERHNEYLSLAYRQNTTYYRRIVERVKKWLN